MSGPDLLDMAYINSLPQPFSVRLYGEECWWPVHDIEVSSGLLRMDVCGKLQPVHIGDVASVRDIEGDEHNSNGFYADAIAEERLSASSEALPGDPATCASGKAGS